MHGNVDVAGVDRVVEYVSPLRTNAQMYSIEQIAGTRIADLETEAPLDVAVGAMPTELALELSSLLDENPDLRVGDTGEDILRGLAGADRAIGDFLSPMLRQYGLGVVADAHDMRMQALAEATPDYYGPGAPGGARPPSPPAAPGPAAKPGGFQFANLAQKANVFRRAAAQVLPAIRIDPRQVEESTMRRLKELVGHAISGEPSSQQYFRTMQARALAGDVDMRREWKAAMAIAEAEKRRRGVRTSPSSRRRK